MEGAIKGDNEYKIMTYFLNFVSKDQIQMLCVFGSLWKSK